MAATTGNPSDNPTPIPADEIDAVTKQLDRIANALEFGVSDAVKEMLDRLVEAVDGQPGPVARWYELRNDETLSAELRHYIIALANSIGSLRGTHRFKPMARRTPLPDSAKRLRAIAKWFREFTTQHKARARVPLAVLNERCDTARSEFSKLAERLRRIRARKAAKGQAYVERICAQAAKLAKDSGFEFVRSIRKWPQTSYQAIDLMLPDVAAWYDAWLSICFEMQQAYPDRVPPDLGVMNWQNSGTADVPCLFRNPRAEDWQQRAEDFAVVCELLAELVDSESRFAKLRDEQSKTDVAVKDSHYAQLLGSKGAKRAAAQFQAFAHAYLTDPAVKETDAAWDAEWREKTGMEPPRTLEEWGELAALAGISPDRILDGKFSEADIEPIIKGALRRRKESLELTPRDDRLDDPQTAVGKSDRQLKPSEEKAYRQYNDAIRNNPELKDDHQVFDFLLSRADTSDELPKRFDTWQSQLSRARRFYEDLKHNPRTARTHGTSVARSDQI